MPAHTLTSPSTLAQACEPVSGAAGRVLSLGTTAKSGESWRFNPDRQTWAPDDRRPDPEWCRDAEWVGDLEYVWRSRMAPRIAAWEAAAGRLGRAVRRIGEVMELRARRESLGASTRTPRELDGLRNVNAPGVRRDYISRRALRVVVTDERRIVVKGPHGAMTLEGRRVELAKSAEHAEARARAAAMSRRDIVGTCGRRFRTVACGCSRMEMEVGCDQTQLCERCRKKHWRRWRRRIVKAMGTHLRVAVDGWKRKGSKGPRPGIYLVTLTMPHSGDLVADRRVMGEAWRDLSKRASYGGYQLGERYSLRKWWGHHAVVYEATPGTAGDGHLHAHAAVISQWVPYDELRAQWRRSIPGAEIVDVVPPHRARQKAQAKGYSTNQAGTAANYLAKYVTKGVEPREMTGAKAGELLVAFAGRRKVTTSRYFWKVRDTESKCCAVCARVYRLVEAPAGLQQHAPGAVLASLLARSRLVDTPQNATPQIWRRRAGEQVSIRGLA